MSQRPGSVHEPDAELLDADEAIRDVEQLRKVFRLRRTEREVPMKVPLSALLDALDFLEPRELKQIADRVEERLVAVGGS